MSPAPTAARPPAPWPRYVAVILRSRLRAGWRRWRRRRLGIAAAGLLLALALAAAVGLAVVGLGLGQGLRLANDAYQAQLTAAGVSLWDLPFVLPSLVFMAGWASLFLLSFASLLGALYLRRDLPALLVAPVPMRAVFTAQFLEALALPLFWTLALALPLLWGYGRGLGLGPAYFPASLIAALLLPLLPLGLAAAATLLLLRLVPAPRAAEILTLLGTLFGVGIWVFSQSLGDVAQRLGVTGAVVIERGSRLAAPPLPWAWAGRALVAAGRGEWWPAVAFGAAFAALSLGTFFACVLLAERVYYDGWAQGRESRRRRRRDRAAAAPGGDLLARLLPMSAVAIARKDWRLMRRDPRGYSALIWIVAMVLFWTWRMGEDRGNADADVAALMAQPALGTLASLAPAAAALILSGMRWGMESVSRDQRAFQIVQAAPVRWRHVALGKWLGAFLPTLAVALVVLSISSAAMNLLAPAVVVRNVLTTVPILAAETALMVAMGSARPRFDWEDPKEMSAGLTGCLGGLLAWTYVGVSLLLVALGLAGAELLGLPAVVGWLGWAVATALALIVAWLGLSFAAGRLAELEL